MKIANKLESSIKEKTIEAVSGEELSEEEKEKINNYKVKGTANGYDLAVGIIGILLSIAVIVAFITLFFVFIFQLAQ